MPPAKDLLYPANEKYKHKLKKLVPKPNSYFMDILCPRCFNIEMCFSHAQSVVFCKMCTLILCVPTGGKVIITEGCRYYIKKP